MLSSFEFFEVFIHGFFVVEILWVYDRGDVILGVEVSRAMGLLIIDIVCGFRLCSGMRLVAIEEVSLELLATLLFLCFLCRGDGSKS